MSYERMNKNELLGVLYEQQEWIAKLVQKIKDQETEIAAFRVGVETPRKETNSLH